MPLCKNPYMAGTLPCPCGKCIPCLINRKRLWKHRLILESYLHSHSAFVTLTYSDDHLHYRNEKTGQECLQATLRPLDLKNFLKRIRKGCAPRRLRFYGVGEYGDKSARPHYHVALYGYEPCWYGETRKQRHAEGKSCCPPCDLLLRCWARGGVDNALLEPESAGYITGYVTKKLTNPNDQKAKDFLNGRYPEFARMSNRPGIGAGAVDALVDTLSSRFGEYMLTEHGDVPVSLFHGGRPFPLGRYLRKKLRERMGMPEVVDPVTGEIKYEAQQKTLQAYKDEMSSLFKTALSDEKKKKTVLTIRQMILDRDAQMVRNVEVKHNLKQKARKL